MAPKAENLFRRGLFFLFHLVYSSSLKTVTRVYFTAVDAELWRIKLVWMRVKRTAADAPQVCR